jgi:hypothetical protein
MLALGAVVMLINGCATPIEATTDFDRGYDFQKVKTLAFAPFDRTDPRSIRISDMQVDRINEELGAALRVRGYEVVDDTAQADLWVSWHLVTQERTDVRSYNSMSYYNCWRCGPAVSDVSVRQYTQGTLIVDMIDPMRNQSVWRGLIEGRLPSQPDPKRRQEVIAAIFADFPPY